MCGIAGILSIQKKLVQPHRLQAMVTAIQHRGPDGEGIWMNANEQVALGHRRLAIIDVTEAAAQPLHYLHYTIVHNGEIYNYVELRQVLQQKGYQFTSQSDTEVILAAYDCWKEKCLQYFDGMFAFAIWDEKKQQLFAARDRFGEKPFFFHHDETEQQLLLASEIKALWAAGLPKQIHQAQLLQYLTLGICYSGENKTETFYSNVQQLPAAHYLLYTPATNLLQLVHYFDIDKDAIADISVEDAANRFDELFDMAVARRLRSDVMLGTSLSGGLDSASVAATIKKMLAQDAHPLQTFSAVFPGFEKDETHHIKTLVEKFGLINNIVAPDAEGLIKDFDTLCFHHEQPFDSASVYAQYKVFELAKQYGVKVLLDGQGADETLAGYTKYLHWFLQQLLAQKSFATMQQQKKLLQPHYKFSWGLKNYAAAFFPATAQQRLQLKATDVLIKNKFIKKDFAESVAPKTTLQKPVITTLNDALYFDTMQGPLEVLLRNADRNSMAHGCEVRLPFLFHELVQFAFTLAATHKINNGFTKLVLRNNMQGILPESIVWRTDKIGFEPPQKQWMQHPHLQQYIQAAKQQLVDEHILTQAVLQTPITPTDAYVADNNDWRWLVAGKLMG